MLAFLVLATALDTAHADLVCDADCNASRTVEVHEIIYCVNVAMESQPFEGCPSCDADQSGTVEVNDLVAAVNDALEGCAPPGGPASCFPIPDYVPTTCTEELPTTVPQIIDRCYKVTKAGTYTGGNVNIISRSASKGAIYIVEDPGKAIDIRVNSLLVEKGGTLQAGSPDCPFGQQGGKLSIGLYGDDPSVQATVPNPPPGIQCQTAPRSTTHPCLPSNHDWFPPSFYCTGNSTDPSDPCATQTKPTTNPLNSLLENYGTLNFDGAAAPTAPTPTPTPARPWGYKVLGVSYGGSLNLFGYKGAKALQGQPGKDWAVKYDSDTECKVPTAMESTLDTAEMKAWANLTGSSWVRLQGVDTCTASKGCRVITLDRLVSDWAAGDQIVVGTTDWYPSHSEVRTIRSVSTVDMRTQLTLCRPVAGGTGPGGCPKDPADTDALDYPHFTGIFDAKTIDGAAYTEKLNRTAADLRATVGLLSRSIQIRSLGATSGEEFPAVPSGCVAGTNKDQQCNTDADCPGSTCRKSCMLSGDTPPAHDCYFGGHMMVRQGFKEVQIQGVEFKQLGQGGRMGHYPVHFHLAKSTAYTRRCVAGTKKDQQCKTDVDCPGSTCRSNTFVKDSSIWDSMTRFVVLHGTHGVTVARNVGFLSMGHGYYLEDGSEIDNRLCHNLGVSARASLKEFFNAQANQSNWTGSPKAPALAARYVPPILDGVCPGPHAEDCYCLNPKDPPDLPTSCTVPDDARVPQLRTGSDTFMPVTFWAMNAANEFVGNAAVGVHGFGSCYWLLGSGVSGPSEHHHKFDGLANYNSTSKGYQAPLRRFTGNSCTTAALALPAQAEIPPASIPFKGDPYSFSGFTAIKNPYLLGADGKLKPASKLDGLYDRPAVVGNFQPIQPNTAGPNNAFFTNCAQTAQNGPNAEMDGLTPNTKSCVTTVLDRFTTSYNWVEVNFGSIWLRPWFYLFLNGAITDQLFGGLTFVTAGSWVQVPPAYFSLAKDNLFVGTSQYGTGASRFARRSGPIFAVTADDTLGNYGPCAGVNRVTCNLDAEGVGIWSGAFNPKRLINIYDGPHFADGNLFVNVGAWQCDPQPCGKVQGKCELPDGLPCGIYSSTEQPYKKDDPKPMVVIDAAVGWKQPNGFYYPPAFAYRAATFFKTVPDALKDLNMCYSFGADDGFKEPKLRPGACRHNVVDRTRDYIIGSMVNLAGEAAISGPSNPQNPLPLGPIDFETILIDLDASITGAAGIVSSGNPCTCGADCQIAGQKGKCQKTATSDTCTCQLTLPSTSLSRNAFFDAPAQSDECLSFGLQTSPYQFVTSVMAELEQSPATTNPTFTNKVDPANWPARPAVAIYRQWKLNGEVDNAGQVCDAGVSGTERGTFMVGPNIYHAPTLTQSEPPNLSSAQPGAIYYIDTSGGHVDTKEFTGSVTFTNNMMGRWALAAPGIGTNLVEGQSITVQGASKPANNSTFTVAFVSPNELLVGQPVVTEGPTPNVKVTWQVASQNSLCFPKAVSFKQAIFLKNKSYVLYHLFARNDAAVSYQLFVGDGVQGVNAVQGRYVRVNPHLVGPTGTEASLVTKPCKPGDTSDWCKDLPVPTVKDGLLTVKLDQRSLAADFTTDSRVDYERCMPRDICYYNSTTKKCESCASATGDNLKNCIRQSDLSPDYPVLNLPDATGRKALDVVCQDWAMLASGTTNPTVGEVSMVDCPKDGCLGFAFTLPDTFVGNKTYNDFGAKQTQCFLESQWKDDALVARKDGTSLADPLCGAPRAAMSSDFCGGTVGPSATVTATRTNTPTGMVRTATSTSTGQATPTNTSTRAATATGTVTRTGLVTPTATATGLGTPTMTPTITPMPGAVTPTATPTLTATSGLSWRLNGTPTPNITIPQAGMSYPPGMLNLVDGQNRFCTASGKQPVLTVNTNNGAQPIGVFPNNTIGQVGIANIPMGQPGTYEVRVQTHVPCTASVPTTLPPFSGAITYSGQ